MYWTIGMKIFFFILLALFSTPLLLAIGTKFSLFPQAFLYCAATCSLKREVSIIVGAIIWALMVWGIVYMEKAYESFLIKTGKVAFFMASLIAIATLILAIADKPDIYCNQQSAFREHIACAPSMSQLLPYMGANFLLAFNVIFYVVFTMILLMHSLTYFLKGKNNANSK